MTLRALIFDVDGTLADTERDGHRPAFNAAFAEHDLDWHWDKEFYGRLLAIAGGKERIRYYAAEFAPEVYGRDDFEELLASLHAAKTRHYQRLLASGAVRMRAELGPLICDARTEGLRLAIASSSTEGNIVGLLRTSLGPEAEHWFEVIASGDAIVAKKPVPDVYHRALAALGLPGNDCLAVEDSSRGLTASLAAGIPTVITVSDYTAEDDFSGARMVLPDAGDLSLDRLRQWHATAGTA